MYILYPSKMQVIILKAREKSLPVLSFYCLKLLSACFLLLSTSEIMGVVSLWHGEALIVVISLGSPDSRQNTMRCGLTEHRSVPDATHRVFTCFVLRTLKMNRVYASFSKVMNESLPGLSERAILFLYPILLFSSKSLKFVRLKNK